MIAEAYQVELERAYKVQLQWVPEHFVLSRKSDFGVMAALHGICKSPVRAHMRCNAALINEVIPAEPGVAIAPAANPERAEPGCEPA